MELKHFLKVTAEGFKGQHLLDYHSLFLLLCIIRTRVSEIIYTKLILIAFSFRPVILKLFRLSTISSNICLSKYDLLFCFITLLIYN